MHLYECFADGWLLKGLRESVASAPCLLCSAMHESMDVLKDKIHALKNEVCEMKELIKTHFVKKVRAHKTNKIPEPPTEFVKAKRKLEGALAAIIGGTNAKTIATLFFKDYGKQVAMDSSNVLVDQLEKQSTIAILEANYDEMTSTDDAKNVFNDVLKKTSTSNRKELIAIRTK